MNKPHKGRYFSLISLSLLILSITSLTFAQLSSNQDQRFYLLGTIGGLPVQMDIALADNTLSGTYFYESVGVPLDVSGNLVIDDTDSKNSKWVISESDSEGNETGIFNAELVNPRLHYNGPDSELDNSVLRGSWGSGDGLEQLPFELVVVAEYVFLKIHNGGTIEVETSYPYFLQEQWYGLNPFTSQSTAGDIEFFQEGQLEQQDYDLQGWSSFDTLNIHYLSDSFVSFTSLGWIYTGGAHGLGGSSGQNFARVESDWVELEVGDFFKADSNFLAELEPIIIAALREREADWVMSGDVTSIELDDLYSVIAGPTGFHISFSPYHMGSYAQGTHEVDIPFEAVAIVLNEEGPLKGILEHIGFESGDY